MLQAIDTFWIDHLENMSYLRGSVNLRAYGQRDPLIEYKKEGKRLFEDMQVGVADQVIKMLPQIGAGAFAKEEERLKQTVKNATLISGKGQEDAKQQGTIRVVDKIGRNEMVLVEKDGKTQEVKYKKAEQLFNEGWALKDK